MSRPTAESLIQRLPQTDARRVEGAIERARNVIQKGLVSGTDLRVIRQAFDVAMYTLWQDAIQRLFSVQDRERIDVLAIRQPGTMRHDAARSYIEQTSFEPSIKAEMLALLDELSSLTELYAEAASQPSTLKLKSPKLVYPAVISPAMQQVLLAADAITQQARPEMIKQMARLITTGIDAFLTAAQVAATKGKTLWLYEHFSNVSEKDTIRIVAKEALEHVGRVYVRRGDITAVIQLHADRHVDDLLTRWRHRYFTKLAEVIDHKTGFRSIQIVECKLRIGCLDTVFLVSFSDNAKFNIHKRAEWRYEQGGIMVDDALYFRDVILASGERLTPTAHLMRTVFTQ